jgi:hypothetical protein
MKKNKIDTTKIKEKISKGLDLTFQRLVKQKKAENGILILSDKGQIKKIKATDIH